MIAYGIVQGFAPKITAFFAKEGSAPDGKHAMLWCALLAVVTGVLAVGIQLEWQVQTLTIVGLLIFGAIFAINSSLHSYLIISYAKQDGVSLDVGFYYMANAMGRLVGTVLSGWIYQAYGFAACLWIAFAFLLITSLISLKLPNSSNKQ